MEITKEIVIAMLQNGYIYKHDLVDQNIEAVKKPLMKYINNLFQLKAITVKSPRLDTCTI